MKRNIKNKIIKEFDGNNSPEDFTIPSIGIEDIDRAVFELFDKKSLNIFIYSFFIRFLFVFIRFYSFLFINIRFYSFYSFKDYLLYTIYDI